jgi:GAF domain-containing protein
MTGADVVANRLRVLSESALAVTSVEDLVDAFLEAARELLAVDQVHLLDISEDATVGHARAVAYEAGGMREDAYVQVLDERPSGTTHVVATGDVLHVPHAATSNALRPDYIERFGVASALFLPLAWSGEVRWVAVLLRTRHEPFADATIDLARVVANGAAAGLALLEARERQASRHDRDAALARAAAVVNADLELDAMLKALSREADVSVGGDMAGIYLGDGAGGGVGIAGHNAPPAWVGYRMRPGEGVAGQVLRTGRLAISNAYQTDVQMPETPGLGALRTVVGVPVTWDGTVRGALSVGFERLRRISPAELRTLEAFADLAALACRRAGVDDPPD